MSLTLEEIKERLLRTYDPEDFLEALEITSEEELGVEKEDEDGIE